MSLIKLMQYVYGLIEVYTSVTVNATFFITCMQQKLNILQISFYKIFFEKCKVKVYTNPLSFLCLFK